MDLVQLQIREFGESSLAAVRSRWNSQWMVPVYLQLGSRDGGARLVAAVWSIRRGAECESYARLCNAKVQRFSALSR